MPVGRTLVWALLALFISVRPAHAVGRTDIPSLARQATRIVVGRVEHTADFADGRLLLHTIAVSSALVGEASAQVTVLEEKKSSVRLFEESGSYLLFLGPPPDNSLIRQNIPGGAETAPLRGRAGVVPLKGADDAAITDLIGLLRKDDLSLKEQRRVFEIELRSGADPLVEDAARRLAKAELVKVLDTHDIDVVGFALKDDRTKPETRASLIRAIGRARISAARPLLSGLHPTAGPEIEARAEALRRLGQSVGPDELAGQLNDPDPGVREIGVRALANSRDPEARERIASVAVEPGPRNVRVAAVEALGKFGDPKSLEVLSQTFEDADPDVQNASGRALFEAGTPEAQQTLESLVMDGEGYDVQSRALILLILSGNPTDSDRIQHIRNTHPDLRIRKIIDEGINLAPPGHSH